MQVFLFNEPDSHTVTRLLGAIVASKVIPSPYSGNFIRQTCLYSLIVQASYKDSKEKPELVAYFDTLDTMAKLVAFSESNPSWPGYPFGLDDSPVFITFSKLTQLVREALNHPQV